MFKNYLIFILSLFLLSSCQTTGFISGIDEDWDVSFYSNCQLPKNSISTIEENGNKFLRFQLKNMQKGGCKSDRKRRHGAPYWERAELKQNNFLHTNSTYEIKFKVRFLEGFKGNRETFFQIHQYNKGCSVYPTLMLKFHYRNLRLDALGHEPTYRHKHYTNYQFDSQKLLKKWHEFKIIYDDKKKKINVFLNKELIFDNIKYETDGCGQPHIKFGIYRPGSKYKLKTSVADFDDFVIRKIK